MKILLITSIILLAQHSSAYDGINSSNEDSYQMGFTAGIFLPSSVSSGVSESISVTGLSVSAPTRIADFEAMFFSGQESGIEYMLGSLSMRMDYNVYDVISGFGVFGLTYHRYKAASTSTVVFDYANKTGFQMGFGFTGAIAGDLFLRSDFRLHLGPGKSAYVGVGVVWHFWGSDVKKQAN